MRNIAVIGGGYTSERHISLNSAKQISDSLDKKLYNVYLIDVAENGFFCVLNNQLIPVNMNDFSVEIDGQTIKFDYAYITIHGSPGEDGKVQAVLDLLNVPYSASGLVSSVITFDKVVCKKILADTDIYLAKSVVIKENQPFSIDDVAETVGMPCFVKPNTAGSSYGVSKVYKKEDIIDAVNLALKEDSIVIIEEFIEGTEVSCGVLKTAKNSYVFPVTEIATKNDYFDTEAKYNAELTDEITPARITEDETLLVQKMCYSLYDMLGCKGIVRSDFIVKNGIPYFLEVNSIPGMSAESIIPKQIRTMQKTMTEVFTEIIEDAF